MVRTDDQVQTQTRKMEEICPQLGVVIARGCRVLAGDGAWRLEHSSRVISTPAA